MATYAIYCKNMYWIRITRLQRMITCILVSGRARASDPKLMTQIVHLPCDTVHLLPGSRVSGSGFERVPMIAGLEREGLERQVGTAVAVGWPVASSGHRRAGRAGQPDGKEPVWGGGDGTVSFQRYL
jgi:hypothetical protein